MVKIYVMDTNVLIQNPQALLSFEDNQVILPVVVLEELDNLKKAQISHTDPGRAAPEGKYSGRGPAGTSWNGPGGEKLHRCKTSGRSAGG